ncbi:MFS general substrate transporter [Thozetella sp. PMI_491]|nr:MFS general substrate transporter [Thozetella sp. PMI_491]
MKADRPVVTAPLGPNYQNVLDDSASETSAQQPGCEEVPTFPEGGYGWIVVACAMSINAVTFGINTTYGVYTSFYTSHSYFLGGTVLRYAFVGGLSVGIALLCAPLSSYLAKSGFKSTQELMNRLTGDAGAIGTALGQCLAGISPNYAAFLAFQGVVFGIGKLAFVPVQPVLAHWFNKRLSLAQGFATAGSGIGGLLFSNTTRLAIENIGVKYALICSGCVSAAVLFPAIFLLKERTKELKAKNAPLKVSFLWHAGFVWVWTWGAFSMMGYFIALYSLATYSTDGLGLSQTQGAGLQSLLAAGQMIGRPLCGLVMDLGGRLNMAILLTILAGISCIAVWLPAQSFGVLALFAVIQGMVGGTVWSASSPVATSIVGVGELGSVLNVFWLALALPALFAQPIAVELLEYSRSSLGRSGADAYAISIGFCGGMFLFAAALLCFAKVWLQKSTVILEKI